MIRRPILEDEIVLRKLYADTHKHSVFDDEDAFVEEMLHILGYVGIQDTGTFMGQLGASGVYVAPFFIQRWRVVLEEMTRQWIEKIGFCPLYDIDECVEFENEKYKIVEIRTDLGQYVLQNDSSSSRKIVNFEDLCDHHGPLFDEVAKRERQENE